MHSLKLCFVSCCDPLSGWLAMGLVEIFFFFKFDQLMKASRVLACLFLKPRQSVEWKIKSFTFMLISLSGRK